VNVGDLKPMEFPIEFFLTMAWNPARWPYERVEEYSRAWAAREFGAAHAAEAAALLTGYTKLNSLRKPEMLAPDTYSLVNYDEAERILWQWRTLSKHARGLQTRLPAETRDAFFQLVAYPVVASAAVQEMYTAVGRNRLYAAQGRTDAARQAENARNWFRVDGELAEQYHSLRGGKWSHMMDQINIGYTTWQQPEMEVMPAVSDVRAHSGPAPAMAIEGSEIAWPSYRAPPAVLPMLEDVGTGSRWLELFNRGDEPYTYEARADQPWIIIDKPSGAVSETVRLTVRADWRRAPADAANATINVATSAGETLTATIPVRKSAPRARGFRGFVASDGVVAIEAPHFARAVSDGEVGWKELPGFGRGSGAVTVFPVDAAVRQPSGKTPRLEYDFWLHSTGEVQVELHCAPSLDFQSGDGLRVAVSIDDAQPQVLRLDTWNKEHWSRAVGEGARRIASRHGVATSGKHSLKVWMITPGVVLERIVIDAGGLRPSYLGPPESARIGAE
jgi:hypothetical protein